MGRSDKVRQIGLRFENLYEEARSRKKVIRLLAENAITRYRLVVDRKRISRNGPAARYFRGTEIPKWSR